MKLKVKSIKKSKSVKFDVRSNQKITEKMTFHEVLTRFPETNAVFMKYEMFCAMGCPAAQQETVKEGAQVHRINVKELIKALNKAISVGAPKS
jgi:hybrid cluster-associated redox disulfide protein